MSDLEATVLDLRRRINVLEENGMALRNVVEAIARVPESGRITSAALLLLVQTYDEVIKASEPG